MSKNDRLSDLFKSLKKTKDLQEYEKETMVIKKQMSRIKASNKKIQEDIISEMKSKWDKIHNTSDYKRFVYLVKEEKTFRGSNAKLDSWVNEKFK